MATKQIAVRLTADELTALRRLVPEGTDPARLRALIHNAAITDGLADRIAAAVSKSVTFEANQTRALIRPIGPALHQIFDATTGAHRS